MSRRLRCLHLAVVFIVAFASTSTVWARELSELELLQSQCETGDAMSCAMLGLLHIESENVYQEFMKAGNFFDTVCAGGKAPGCALLGWTYRFGHNGVRENHAKALSYYAQACKLELQFGCESYARLKAGK